MDTQSEEYGKTTELLRKISPLVRELESLGWRTPHVDDCKYELLIIEAMSTGIHRGYQDEEKYYWILDGDTWPSWPLMVKRGKKHNDISFLIPPEMKVFTADDDENITLISDSWDDANQVLPIADIKAVSEKMFELSGAQSQFSLYLTQNQLNRIFEENGLSSLEELNELLDGVEIVKVSRPEESTDECSGD